MGGWQSPTSNLVGGNNVNPDAPLSTLLPGPGAQNPNTPGTSSSSNLQFESNALGTTGTSTTGAGVNLQSQPLNYWQQLLKAPTLTSLTQQQGPAISSVIGQYSTGKKALANAPRGGGTTETAAELPFQESGAITGLLENQLQTDLTQLQPEAAQAISGIGQALSSLGLSELGISSQDLQALVSANLTQEQITAGGFSAVGKGIGSIISSLITAGNL